jgi:hypothetical protein
MGMDRDAQQRLWLHLGYGGKKSEPTTWRYWKKPKSSKEWVIAAPHYLAEFEQHDKTVFYRGEPILTADTQWSATWRALAYFYEKVVPTLVPPPMTDAVRGESTCSNATALVKDKAEGVSLDVVKQALAGTHEREHLSCPERIWVGPRYYEARIFILGESWFGDFEGDLATDDGYITAFLTGKKRDRLYSLLAEACGPDALTFWESVMFTNFVQRVGPTRDHRPSKAQYSKAKDRLHRILVEKQPRGVFILGMEQGKYSAPVVREAGIPLEVVAHPSSHRGEKAVLLARIRVSWQELLANTTARSNDAQPAAAGGRTSSGAPLSHDVMRKDSQGRTC